MSLLNIRRERREEHRGPNRPTRLWRLIVGFIVVVVLLYYLAQIS
jgi:amino acid transporter